MKRDGMPDRKREKKLPEIAEALEMDEETIRGLMEKKELNKKTI